MEAEDVMKLPLARMIDTQKDAPSLMAPESTAHDLARAIGSSAAGAVVVTAADSTVDGIVTNTDIVKALADTDPAGTPPTAASIATEKPVVFQMSTPLEDVVSRLGANSMVVVVNDKHEPVAALRRDQLADRVAAYVKALG